MWRIAVNGYRFESDDMTVEELGEVERISGTPWSVANPLRDIAVAKGFAAVAMLRAGVDKTDVPDRLNKLTLRDLKDAFEWVADADGAEGVDEEPDPSAPPPPPTSRSSSPGGRGKGGRRPKPAESVSATS